MILRNVLSQFFIVKCFSKSLLVRLKKKKIYLKLENAQVALLKVSSKLLYTAFKSRKQAPPTAQKKFLEKFPQLQIDWSEIYSLPFIVTIETKIREFQYKILNNIVFTNEKMFRLKMIESPLCTRLLPKKILKGPSELNAENLGALHMK